MSFWRSNRVESFKESITRLPSRMWKYCFGKSNKPKQWKPNALETVMYSAAQDTAHPILIVAALKAIAIAAGYSMPKPEITFQDEAVEFIWRSKNKHVLCMWLRKDGKVDCITTDTGEPSKQDDESVHSISLGMMSHFFVAWGAK